MPYDKKRREWARKRAWLLLRELNLPWLDCESEIHLTTTARYLLGAYNHGWDDMKRLFPNYFDG